MIILFVASGTFRQTGAFLSAGSDSKFASVVGLAGHTTFFGRIWLDCGPYMVIVMGYQWRG